MFKVLGIFYELQNKGLVMKLFFMLILSLNIYAHQILEIKDDFKFQESANFIYYMQDVNNTQTPLNILSSEDLTLAKMTHLGTVKGPFWTRLELYNTSNNVQNLALYNPFANINEIDVYIYKNEKLVQTFFIGDFREQKTLEVLSRFHTFKLRLLGDEKVTIVAKIKNYNLYNIGWNVSNYDDFIKKEFIEILIAGVFFGLIFVYVLFNLFSFIFYKNATYLVIAVIVSTFLVYIYGFNGILYKLDLGLDLHLAVALNWNIGTISILFTMLYPYYFFNMKKNYPKLSYYLKFKIVLILAIIFTTLYAQFVDESYFFVATVLFLFIILNSLSLLSLAIYMYGKKESGSEYYLLGQGGLMVGIIVYLLNMLNYIPHSELNNYMLPIGMIVDYIFFSIALYKRNKNKVIELENQKNCLLEQARFNSIGQAIGHITHQWKVPLTYLGTSITMLEATFYHKKEDFETTFITQLPNLKNNINLMKETINEFALYYSGNIEIKDFEVKKSLDNILKLLHSKIVLHKVTINLQIEELPIIYGYEHLFSNIVLVLINNSLEQFKENATTNQITITLSRYKENIKLTYTDNAGGITVEPVEKIFDYFVSTKKSNNSGIGLSIVKMLVEDRLKGNISVKNISGGVKFEVVF